MSRAALALFGAGLEHATREPLIIAAIPTSLPRRIWSSDGGFLLRNESTPEWKWRERAAFVAPRGAPEPSREMGPDRGARRLPSGTTCHPGRTKSPPEAGRGRRPAGQEADQ